MGRRRVNNLGLPPRMHEKSGSYYHVSSTLPRIWTALGKDLNQARKKWAELEEEPIDQNDKTFSVIARRYVQEILPTKSRETQKGNLKELEQLNIAFGHMPIDAITPFDVRKYMDIRGLKAKVRANREKALLSHIFNKSREWGYTNATNPCQGVKGFKETGRDTYISDAQFKLVWEVAHFTVQDAMDIAYLTGQRPADVIKILRSDIRDGGLHVKQNKTQKMLNIVIEGDLKAVIERILARPQKATGLHLIQDENGQRLTYFALRSRFDKARLKVGATFQFRDIRAKTGSDTGDLGHSQKLLGHKNRDMTEHYVRSRIGERVKPLK